MRHGLTMGELGHWFIARLQGHWPPLARLPAVARIAYEYEHERLAIDLINGSPLLRECVDDVGAGSDRRDAMAASDERVWHKTRRNFLLY